MSSIQTELWTKIQDFNFDSLPGEYGFSVRLAHENYWTENFTKKAIFEYKKFMYLAATSAFMVSPSEIIDVVWHQHLIFTQSYQEFGKLIGKQIQHVPSTHNKADFQKFMQAKQRTTELYKRTFGDQPDEIWNQEGMYESLELPKAKFHIRSFILFGVLTFVWSVFGFYHLLIPVYSKISSSVFMPAYIILLVVVFIGLRLFNRSRLTEYFARTSNRPGFINELTPAEVGYLKAQKLEWVVHNAVNSMINKGILVVKKDMLEFNLPKDVISVEGITNNEVYSYRELVTKLKSKPFLSNVANSMDAFRKYFNKSMAFGKMFYINFLVLALTFMLGFQRLTIGMARHKPSLLIFLLVIFLFVIIIWHLRRLLYLMPKVVAGIYKERVLPQGNLLNDDSWQYFLLGEVVLTPAFRPLVTRYETEISSSSDSSSSGSGSSSSCGSSCSSCGGCGGGD